MSPRSNTIRFTQRGSWYGSWFYKNITQDDINNAREMKGKIEVQGGYTNYADYNLIRGTYLNDNVSVNGSLKVNDESVLTTSSLNSLSPNGIGIGGPVPANGVRIRNSKTIGSQNLENGALIVQDGGVGKLAIDSNELVTSHSMHYTALAAKSKHRFMVPASSSHREVIAEFRLSDTHARGVMIGNATGYNNQMIPTVTGYTDMSTREALQVTGSIQPNADVNGMAAVDIVARTHNGVGNPLNSAAFTPLQNRDILQVRNHSTKVLKVSNQGHTTITNTAFKSGLANSHHSALTLEGGLIVEGNSDFRGDTLVRQLEVDGYAEFHGEIDVDGEVMTNQLRVFGDTRLGGNVTISQPQGDISMGIFGSE